MTTIRLAHLDNWNRCDTHPIDQLDHKFKIKQWFKPNKSYDWIGMDKCIREFYGYFNVKLSLAAQLKRYIFGVNHFNSVYFKLSGKRKRWFKNMREMFLNYYEYG